MNLRVSLKIKECADDIANAIYSCVKKDFLIGNRFMSRNIDGIAISAEFDVCTNTNESKDEFVARFFHTVWKAAGAMIAFPIDVTVLSERYEPDGEDLVLFVQAKRESLA